MLRKLIDRPVAVTMTVVAILIVGIVAIGRLPVSLMPDVDIPQITVQLDYKGASAREVDQTVIQPLRRELLQLPSLEQIRCNAVSGGGNIFLQFEHGSDIDYIFIEVNEKVDRALQKMPEGLSRPKVIKASATDIPAFFVDVVGGDGTDEGFISLSRFSQEVIAKRIEQLPQVALVDVSGILGSRIVVDPDMQRLASLGVGVGVLESAISGNNVSLGNLTIRDGCYQWNIRFDSELRSREDIENINVNIGGRVFLFKELAAVSLLPQEASGLVRSNGSRAVTMAVIKQSDAQMSALKKSLADLMEDFSEEYPELSFTVSRDQTELLDYSISNLKSNILIGALLAVLVLLLFMKDFRSPVLVAVTIPLSIVSSMLLLYLMGISINIISLSGLILGIGMMVDNSIIVIDNITQWWGREQNLKEAAVHATKEVVGPMVSSVLTTCSVFIPLIFLSGIAGSLFFDQAMAVTVTLVTSLAVSVLVIPVYFCLFYRGETEVAENRLLSRLQRWDYTALYEKALKWSFRHQKAVWTLVLAMIAGAVVLFAALPKSKLPPLTHDDFVAAIDWNSPLTIEESDSRTADLLQGLEDKIVQYDALVGRQDFLLSHTEDIDLSQVQLYVKASSERDVEHIKEVLASRVEQRWSGATCSFSESANIFNVIFSDDESDLIALLRPSDGSIPDPDRLNSFLSSIGGELPGVQIAPVVWQEQIMLVADREKMALYGIDYSSIYNVLSRATRERTLFSIRSGSFVIPVVFGEDDGEGMLSQSVTNGDGVEIPLSYLLIEHRIRDLKHIVSVREGNCYPLAISAPDGKVKPIVSTVGRLARESGEWDVNWGGSYFSSRKLIRELAVVLLISVLLLFFILAAQFESLVQPLIILSEICVDIFGALFALWICGAGINLMSLIGIVVMCGIVINDSILKVDTINRHRSSGMPLVKAIMLGGGRRLKPILMTSITTILAIAPFLVKGSLGADLQFPLSVALIGGMIPGTLVSLLFIPLFYYKIYRRSGR